MELVKGHRRGYGGIIILKSHKVGMGERDVDCPKSQDVWGMLITQKVRMCEGMLIGLKRATNICTCTYRFERATKYMYMYIQNMRRYSTGFPADRPCRSSIFLWCSNSQTRNLHHSRNLCMTCPFIRIFPHVSSSMALVEWLHFSTGKGSCRWMKRCDNSEDDVVGILGYI